MMKKETSCFKNSSLSDSDKSLFMTAIDLTKQFIEFIANLAATRIWLATGDKKLADEMSRYMTKCAEDEMKRQGLHR